MGVASNHRYKFFRGVLFPTCHLILIAGVKALSRNEIKKDLTEIEYCDKSDSESVSSADSGDVISSSYPVKPRKHARIQRDSRPSRPSKDTESSQSKEDAREYNAVEFLRVVESARPEIFEAEREREDLEIRFQVYFYIFIYWVSGSPTNDDMDGVGS